MILQVCRTTTCTPGAPWFASVGVPELGYVVQERRDYDPSGKHKWGFTLKCKYRDLDVIAPSELVYKIWVEGLRCLREYATTVVATATPVADEFVAETAAFCTDC